MSALVKINRRRMVLRIQENIQKLTEDGPVPFCMMYDFVMQVMHLSRIKYEMDFDYKLKEIYINIENELIEIQISQGLLTDDMG
jgi:hypothetical protein